MFVVIQHHEDQLQPRHPLPLVVATCLELVGSLLERCPAVGLTEYVSPEIDTLRDVCAIVVHMATGPVLEQGHEIFAVHAEQGLHQVEVARPQHRPVRQARVHPPIARAPPTVIGITGFFGMSHSKNRAVELDRIPPASRAGVDIALQGISTRDHECIILLRFSGRYMNPTTLPELTPPALVGLAPFVQRDILGGGDRFVGRFQPLLRRGRMLSQHADGETVGRRA
ncbi:hypothetical protein ES703_67334 [subsurface metagenome]